MLIYALEACPLLNSDLLSLDFVVNRFFMKSFRTGSMDVVKQCQYHFGFPLPIVFYGLNVFRNMKRNLMPAITPVVLNKCMVII